ncbi:hypothetical protein CYMTET_43235 [Cymbomonas tetramitiformis]|uniref:Uncharacterized protein n=1 Tax=Cymbomonas tetramitiformis TaxID=36881 RepID=A0AAE0C480_9CHLO|nr:hypothetical protein CYMTET_43235 [Cymbomonas tetramitiformis]
MAWTWIYLVESFRENLRWGDSTESTEAFFNHDVLNRFDTLADLEAGLGRLNWRLSIAVVVQWCLVFTCTAKGVKTAEVVVKLSTPLPFIMLGILLVYGATLDGAADGIQAYIAKFDIQRLKAIEPWVDAAGQIFFGLSVGGGMMLSYASSQPKTAKSTQALHTGKVSPFVPEVVRNTPTLATPEVEDPGAAKADDTANVIARRKYFSDQTNIVKRVRESGLHRKWAKNLRERVLGRKHEKFAGKDKDVAKLGKLIVILKTEVSTAGLDLASFEFDNPVLEVIPLVNELVYDTFSEVKEHAALHYPARVDPQPVLAKEHRLVCENRAADWQPTEATRRQQLFDRLNPDFYRAVRDHYSLLADLLVVSFEMLAQLVTIVYTNWAEAQQGEVVGTAAAAAIPTGDDSEAKQLLKAVVDKLRVLEHFIKNQKGGTTALKAVTAARGGLSGYRPGLEKGSGKQVAFDPDVRRAVPRCYRCAKADRGVLYHAYKDCPLGGGRAGAHAFCCPAAEHDENEMHALALCHVKVCEVHGAPEVLRAGGSTAGADLSMYGFAVGGAQGQKEQEEVLGELGGISERLTSLADAVGLSLTTASIAGGEAGEVSPNAVGMLPAAGAGGDGGRALVAQAEDALEVVVPRVTTVLQDAGAAGSVCPRGCCFGPECAWGMPQSGADAPLQAAAVKAESESSDNETAEVHARPRHQVGCGRSPFGIVPRHVAIQGLFALLCFGMLVVGAALCIGGGAAADTIGSNGNFNI